MRPAILALVTFALGISVGYQWSTYYYGAFKEKLGQLVEIDVGEYLRLKESEEKYEKANEILGKAILLFLADLHLRISDDKVEFAKRSIEEFRKDSALSVAADKSSAAAERTAEGSLPNQTERSEPKFTPTMSDQFAHDSPSNVQEGAANSLTGRIKYTGAVPTADKIKMNADPACQKEVANTSVYKEDLVVNSGMLANVFVYLKEGATEAASSASALEPVVFDQRGCSYRPHVLGVRVGQPLRILNSDPTMHNVHSLSKINPSFNNAMPTKGQFIDKVFSKAEQMIRIKCDFHGWMNAFIWVMDHPYFAISDLNGVFTMLSVPPGEYVIEAWHEKLGIKSQRIHLGIGQKARPIEFTFSGAS